MATKQEKTRYSDEELQEFKELIIAKIEQAEENYKRLTDTIMVDESDPTFKMMECRERTGGEILTRGHCLQTAWRVDIFTRFRCDAGQ